MGFLSGLLSVGLDVGRSFLGSKLAQKRQKSAARNQAKRGVTNAQGQSVRQITGHVRRDTPLGPVSVPSNVSTRDLERAMKLGSSAIPPWHAAVHQIQRGRRRRMNVGNTKALTRALRRAEGWVKLTKRTEKALRRISPPRKSRSAPARREIC